MSITKGKLIFCFFLIKSGKDNNLQKTIINTNFGLNCFFWCFRGYIKTLRKDKETFFNINQRKIENDDFQLVLSDLNEKIRFVMMLHFGITNSRIMLRSFLIFFNH